MKFLLENYNIFHVHIYTTKANSLTNGDDYVIVIHTVSSMYDVTFRLSQMVDPVQINAP